MKKKEWKIAGTYVTGLSHVSRESGCQDRFSYKQSNSISTISLADGAGSAKFSELGATITSEQINNYMVKNFNSIYFSNRDETVKKVIHSLRTSLGIHAKRKSVLISELASTLLFASVKDGKYIVGHIGDGVIGFLINNQLEIMSLPENGEFINETFFVTSKSYRNRFRIYKGQIKNITGFILMTDGTSESLFDKKNSKLAPVAATLLKWLDLYPPEVVNSALHENFEQVIRIKTTDDCSIGMMKLC